MPTEKSPSPQRFLAYLGYRARDRVTGMEGVIVSVVFDLYGCIQVILNPGLDKEGKPGDSHYYDVSRLEFLSKKPVMDQPNYHFGPQAEGKQGAAEKPKLYKP